MNLTLLYFQNIFIIVHETHESWLQLPLEKKEKKKKKNPLLSPLPPFAYTNNMENNSVGVVLLAF